MQICHKSVKTVTGTLCSGTVVPYHRNSYMIITTNKSPSEWAKSLDDETLATALLDRLLYKCQLIQLQGKSYRMQNRKTIFNDPKN